MKITFLGTGAADWKFEKHKDVEGFRRNSAILIDDCLLIDPGPDVPDALCAFGKSVDRITHVINTHRHSDHYSEKTLDLLQNADFHPMCVGESAEIGGYRITALPANHSTCKDTVHFIISDGKTRIFYGLDGAWLLYDEVEAIKNGGVDLAILEATIGDIVGDWRVFEHNNLNMVREIRASLADSVKRFCISHMAMTLHTSHAELVACMKPEGIEVAFDGLTVEV